MLNNEKLTQYQLQDSVMQFFTGLNVTYSQIRGQLLLLDPLPSINKVYSLLIQDESQRSIAYSAGDYVESIALAAQLVVGSANLAYGGGPTGKGSKNKGKDRPVCSHSGITGHIMEKCCKLHGYPPGYRAKRKSPKANQVVGLEFGSAFGGVESDLMPVQQPYSPQGFPFTQDQYQRLLALIGGPGSGFQDQRSNATPEATSSAMANSVSVTTPLASKPYNLKHSIFAAKIVNRNAYSYNTWVLDIGATDHIICLATLLTTITSLTQSIVKLPNGESAQVTHIGIVQLFATLFLDNVLCVPSFSFNLLSISKLTQKMPYCLVFLSQFCFI